MGCSLSECRSGLFHLEGLSQEKVPAAKHLQIICPHHCQHELEAINRNTLICSQCDPRLAHIEGGQECVFKKCLLPFYQLLQIFQLTICKHVSWN